MLISGPAARCVHNGGGHRRRSAWRRWRGRRRRRRGGVVGRWWEGRAWPANASVVDHRAEGFHLCDRLLCIVLAMLFAFVGRVADNQRNKRGSSAEFRLWPRIVLYYPHVWIYQRWWQQRVDHKRLAGVCQIRCKCVVPQLHKPALWCLHRAEWQTHKEQRICNLDATTTQTELWKRMTSRIRQFEQHELSIWCWRSDDDWATNELRILYSSMTNEVTLSIRRLLLAAAPPARTGFDWQLTSIRLR